MHKYLLIFAILTQSFIDAVEFVLFTQPKTATHFLIPVLSELTGKKVYWAKEFTSTGEPFEQELWENSEFFPFNVGPLIWKKETMNRVWQANKSKGTFLHLHAPYSVSMENFLAKKKCINFFIKRDPRDQIISLLNHYKYIYPNDPSIQKLDSDKEKLLSLIRNSSRKDTTHYMKWIHSPVCCTLDFHKLMGLHGGRASDIDAVGEMRKIAQALKLDLSDEYLYQVYKRHFGHGWSFFKGKVGCWQEYFDDELIALIKEEIGDLLIELGFEKDLCW